MKKVPSSKFQVPGWLAGGIVFLLLAGGVLAADTTGTASFDQANKLYEEGQFTNAAAAYDGLAKERPGSETLWFNLGNAHYKAGEIGRAIAAYRRAETLAPRDPDVRFNLQYVRKQAVGAEAPAGPWLERTLRALTLNEWTLLACAAGWALFGLLAIGQWKAEWRQRVRTWAGLSAGLTMLFGTALVGAVRIRYYEPEAVIVAHEAAVRNGPLDESKTAFTARDGTEMKVLDEHNGWWQVKDMSGHIGWVRQADGLLLTAR